MEDLAAKTGGNAAWRHLWGASFNIARAQTRKEEGKLTRPERRKFPFNRARKTTVHGGQRGLLFPSIWEGNCHADSCRSRKVFKLPFKCIKSREATKRKRGSGAIATATKKVKHATRKKLKDMRVTSQKREKQL